MKNIQSEPITETSGKIQVKNGIDFHQPFCLNLNGFNTWHPQKPGRKRKVRVCD